MKSFRVHTGIFIPRSGFFAAARRPEWIASDPTKPVDLSDEDPSVFHAYSNCVYSGPDTLEEVPGTFEHEVRGGITGFSRLYVCNVCVDVSRETLTELFAKFGEVEAVDIVEHYGKSPLFESPRVVTVVLTTDEAGEAAVKALDGHILSGHRLSVWPSSRGVEDRHEHYRRKNELADEHYDKLIKLYLLADKLQDIATTNMVMDKIEQFYRTTQVHPGQSTVYTVYHSTERGSPLRKLLRNMWFYYTDKMTIWRAQEHGFPKEFLRDEFEHFIMVKAAGKGLDNFSNVALNDHLEGGGPAWCRYHQHDEEHPFCLTSWQDEEHCKSCRAKKKR